LNSWDYEQARFLFWGSYQTKVHFATQSLGFFCFSGFLSGLKTHERFWCSWDYEQARFLFCGSSQTKVHFATQSLGFCLFFRLFEMDFKRLNDHGALGLRASSFSLNGGSIQTKVHFATQSLGFFCFSGFLK
jgi:hypothetical protein